MKLSKAIFAAIAGTALATSAMGEEAKVGAEKKSAIKSLLPDSYGKVEVRHATFRKMDDDKVTNDVPRLDARPTLGTTLMDGAVDTSFTWIFRKTADTNQINRVTLYNVTEWKIVEGDLGYLAAYGETYQAEDSTFSESYLGFYGELNKSVDIAGGSLAFNGYTQPVAELKSNKTANGEDNKVSVKNETGLALTEGEDSIEQRDPTMFNYAGVGGKFKPAAVAGLSVGLAVDYINRWKPKYAAKDVDGETRYDLDGYESTALTINKFTVGYKLSDAVSLAGQLRQNINGFYAEGLNVDSPDRTGNVGDTRWESRLSLTATLF